MAGKGMCYAYVCLCMISAQCYL
eukprot:SAG31_NODE_5198_length_2682_cov_1.861789_1_plen_22_part_10